MASKKKLPELGKSKQSAVAEMNSLMKTLNASVSSLERSLQEEKQDSARNLQKQLNQKMVATMEIMTDEIKRVADQHVLTMDALNNISNEIENLSRSRIPQPQNASQEPEVVIIKDEDEDEDDVVVMAVIKKHQHFAISVPMWRNPSISPNHCWNLGNTKHHVGRIAILKSGTFKIKHWGVCMQFQCVVALGLYDFSFKFLKPSNSSQVPNLQLSRRVFFILRDVIGQNSRDKELSVAPPFGSPFKLNTLYAFTQLPYESFLKNYEFQCRYLYHTVGVDVYVDDPRHFYSNDGILLWEIPLVEEKRLKMKEGLSEGELSPYFYTDIEGYRVQLRLRFGTDEFQFVSMEVNFLSGEFDNQLRDVFPHLTQVSLINPNDPDGSIVKRGEFVMSKEETTFAIFVEEFGALQRTGFMRNDSFVFKVQITPSLL